jgi:hypothetical protein
MTEAPNLSGQAFTLRDAKARDRAFYKGIRACITRLHELAREMNDPHAKAVLNSAAFDLGVFKPSPEAALSAPAEERSAVYPAVTSGDDREERDRSFFRAGYCAAYRDGGNDHTGERKAYIGRLAEKAWRALPGYVPPAPPAEARSESYVEAGWRTFATLPEVGCKFIALYNDGSGAAMFWRHDDGYIDADGDEYGDLSFSDYDHWAYLPHDLEFGCENYAEDPMTFITRAPAEARSEQVMMRPRSERTICELVECSACRDTGPEGCGVCNETGWRPTPPKAEADHGE